MTWYILSILQISMPCRDN